MSIIDTLITNRTLADASRVKYLSFIGWDNMTNKEQDEWLYGNQTEAVYWADGEPMICTDGQIFVFAGSGTNIGAYNYTDLNRVCEAQEYLYNRLNEFGYSVDYTPIKANWNQKDIPTTAQMEQYLKNTQVIRNELPIPIKLDIPKSMDKLTVDSANNIEKALIEVDSTLTSISKIFIRSNMPLAVSGGIGIYAIN